MGDKYRGDGLHSLPMAARTNYHKLDGFKQLTFVTLQSWRSEGLTSWCQQDWLLLGAPGEAALPFPAPGGRPRSLAPGPPSPSEALPRVSALCFCQQGSWCDSGPASCLSPLRTVAALGPQIIQDSLIATPSALSLSTQ